MFKKLRNQFLLLNLSITSAIITLAFGFVYFLTYSNLQADIRNRLQAQPEAQMQIVSDIPDPQTAQRESQPSVRHVMTDGVSTFQVEVDANGEIVQIASSVHLPEESYRQLVEIAWNNRNEQEVIRLKNRQWRYAVSPIRVQVIGEDRIPVAGDPNTYSILFLDVTETYATLAQLLTTLLLVGALTLVVIFGISLYFANRAIQPIRESWERQKQFFADVSHELKTPLSIIHANCDALAANRDDTVASQMKWIDYIRAGTNRMTKLVHQLLTLAKADEGHPFLQMESFNISDVVNKVCRSMEAAAAGKGLSFTHSIAPDLIAKGDPDGIKQVVELLLDNATKYANPGGWIELSLARTGRHITFSISNSGPGIAKEDLPRVFDRFFRADRSRSHQDGSYGLGLSIAQSIIQQHGGEIKVKSEEQVSTTFSFAISGQ